MLCTPSRPKEAPRHVYLGCLLAAYISPLSGKVPGHEGGGGDGDGNGGRVRKWFYDAANPILQFLCEMLHVGNFGCEVALSPPACVK